MFIANNFDFKNITTKSKYEEITYREATVSDGIFDSQDFGNILLQNKIQFICWNT